MPSPQVKAKGQVPCLIVEEVSTGSVAERAGIQPGDRLLRYAGQALSSAALLQALEENTFMEEPVVILTEREGEVIEKSLPCGKLRLEVRPDLAASVQVLYEQAKSLEEQGKHQEAARLFEQAAAQAEEFLVSCWLLERAGVQHEHASAWQEALVAYEQAFQKGEQTEEQAVLFLIQLAIGRCYEKINEYRHALEQFQQSVKLAEQASWQAWLANSLDKLGVVVWRCGDLATAQVNFLHSLAIVERISSDSQQMARCLNNLGVVAYDRGDLVSAQDYHARALAIEERLAAGSLNVAASFDNLGLVACGRGDLVSAQDYHARALAIREKLAPDSMEITYSLNNLGVVAYERGDLAAAQDYYTRALTIREKLAPGSPWVATSLNNLGNVAYGDGDLAAAQAYYISALVILEKLAPGSLHVAASLNNLGMVTCDRGDLVSAQDYHARALAIKDTLAPGSLNGAHSLNNLGVVAYERGDLAAAQDYYTRALTIREKLAPGSLEVAESHEHLGKLTFKKQEYPYAVFSFQQAISILEAHRSQIAAPDARALLLAKHISKYISLIQAYQVLDQLEKAFTTLERARARSLLELLVERQIDLSAEAPTTLLEEHKELDRQRAQTYQELAQLSVSDEPQIQQLHAKLHALESKQQELTAKIRDTSPRYAALEYPQPLEAKAAQAALEAGSLLLSFLVGEEHTYLFALSQQELACYELPVSQKALQEQVQAFREALDVYSLETTLAEALQQGQALYQLLFAPAQEAIDKARRLLICPDGPLHLLPFAALVVKPGKKPVYLGQIKPLHSTFSMTVYVQSRQAASKNSVPSNKAARTATVKASKVWEKLGQAAAGVWQQGWRVLALGDPVYATGNRKLALSGARSARKKPAGNSELAGLRSRGLSLDPLPHTREEVEAIASLFGEQATIRLGEAATKTAALKESEQADVLHFACHGWLDPKMPLSSGLILSQPEALGKKATEQDNGLLQAFEIFKLKLKAELVVLSACQTGLGTEIRGEGLIGLTRAFTYAGAKSVLVSLWEINDKSTSEFMQAFYQVLREGKSKDKALQLAIKKMSKQGKWRHPFFWSAFSLVGDWR